ncbi:prolipoprotein diacylglyceryl transferase [Candidatus Peregrinibacteria bacterium]|nr:prolipoprotein diacylglyceryl transferase [Candidatus Peregrinibacteria bacterium]
MFVNDFSHVALSFWGLEMRWYGILFAVGLLLNFLLLQAIFKNEKYPLKHLDSVAVWLFFGLLFGARLGHVFFYEASYYLSHPVEILKVWNGGLASHGAIIGLVIAYFSWCKVHKVKFLHYVDVLTLGMPLTGAFVRFGNFFNSELVGKPYDGPFAVVFKRLGEDFGRHPVQLYEADMNLLIFGVMLFLYWKFYRKAPRGFFFFLTLGLYFIGRFIAEFFKDHPVLWENLPITMGQFLSLLMLVVPVVYFIFVMPRQDKRGSK